MKVVVVAFLAWVGASLGAVAHASSNRSDCGRGWVYFDLGNTLIDTRDWEHLRYVPGALPYLQALRAAGFHVGLITNVPEDWGKTNDEKAAYLKREIAATWVETSPFAWDLFDRILLPPRDEDRKPAPFLFEQARTLGAGCKIAFEGEDAVETAAASAAGFEQSYVVGREGAEFFAPVSSLLP